MFQDLHKNKNNAKNNNHINNARISVYLKNIYDKSSQKNKFEKDETYEMILNELKFLVCLLEDKLKCTNQELKEAREAADQLKKTREKNNSLCCICLTREKDHAYAYCGHMCVCADCLKYDWTEKCPLCMRDGQNVIKIYT